MAINAQPKVFNVVPGNSADTAELQDAASSTDPSISAIFPPIYQTPLSAGGKAPERTTFNTLFKEYGEHLYYLQRGGVYGYDATLDYGKGATVYYNGAIYTAVAENGPSTDAGAVAPDNAAVWQKVILSGDYDFASLISRVKQLEDDLALGAFKTGDIKQTMNPNFDAAEWVLGNGALVPRTGAYKDLWEFANDLGLVRDASAQASYESDPSTFEGLSYGPGDGSTTFQLPDFRGRVIQGADASHALGHFIKAGLPNITGKAAGTDIDAHYFKWGTPLGAFYADGSAGSFSGNASGTTTTTDLFLSANRSSSIYGSNSTVQSLAIATYSLIKL